VGTSVASPTSRLVGELALVAAARAHEPPSERVLQPCGPLAAPWAAGTPNVRSRWDLAFLLAGGRAAGQSSREPSHTFTLPPARFDPTAVTLRFEDAPPERESVFDP
jgi:hypothetical protein